MNGYKDLNRALTLQNQEFRQEVARLRNEIILLNRELMSEKEKHQACKCRFALFMQQIAIRCSEELSKLNLPFLEKGDRNDTLKDNTLKRSVRSDRPTLREVQLNEANKENVSPLGEEELDENTKEVSYVQTRRRWRNESKDNEETQSESRSIEESSLRGESFDGTEPVAANTQTVQDEAVIEATQETIDPTQEEGEEEDSVQGRYEIPTIQEENSADFTQGGTIAKTISQTISSGSDGSSFIQDSVLSNAHHTLVPQPRSRQFAKSQLLSVPDISISSVASSPSIASRTRQRVLEDDTIFENFKELQAASSTPYKQTKSRLVRNAVVMLKRLNVKDLAESGIRSDQCRDEDSPKQQNHTKSPDTRKRSNRRKNLSPKLSFSSTRLSVEGLHGSSSTNLTRPKRNAAPNSLKEPTLNRKLRRNI